MSWEDILKVTTLENEASLDVKPEEYPENCLRKLKTFAKKFKRLRPTVDYSEYKMRIYTPSRAVYTTYKNPKHEGAYLNQNIRVDIEDEQTACKIIQLLKRYKKGEGARVTINEDIDFSADNDVERFNFWIDSKTTGGNPFFVYIGIGDNSYEQNEDDYAECGVILENLVEQANALIDEL